MKTVSGNETLLRTKAWTVRSRCQTHQWYSSKPDPPDQLQSSRWRPAISRLEARSRLTSHHMVPSDPPGHGNIGDWCSRAGWGQIVLAANRNGGMLWLIASRHYDDDDATAKARGKVFQIFMNIMQVLSTLCSVGLVLGSGQVNHLCM